MTMTTIGKLAISCLCACCAAVRPAPAAPKAPAPKPAAAESPVRQLPSLANANVSLPWRELRGLLEAARGAAKPQPPVSHVFSPASYTATVAGDTARIIGRCSVDVLAERWVLVPLGPAPQGLRKVTLDGKACPVVMRGEALHALLSGKGARAIQIEIDAPVSVAKGTSSFRVPLVPSPVITLTTAVPRAGLDVRATGASTTKCSEAGGKTTAVSGHRGGSVITVSWRVKPARPRALPTRVYADTHTLVTLDDGLVRAVADVRLDVVHSPGARLRFHVDPKAVVLSVTGENLDGWRLVTEKAEKVVEVSFPAGATGERRLRIATERDLPEAGGEVALPVVRLAGAKRDRGTVAVASAGGWEVKPLGADAERIGISQLPATLRKAGGAGLELAYRYRKAPASISLAVARPKRQAAKIYAGTATLVTVESGRLRCRADVRYEVLHDGVDTLRVALPDGAELLNVSAPTLRRTQIVKEAGKRTLVIDLKDVARGSYTFTVTYEKRLADKETSPVVPLLSHPAAAQDGGSIGIEVRGGLEVRASAKGAERVDVKELGGSLWGSARSPLLMGFQYTKPGASLTLGITRHEDVDVLVAMSDVCESATTITPDGKSITKMMFVLRNNLKQFMRLKLPKGAQVWSAFVKDHPVTPVRTAGGDVLVPLVKSDPEDQEEDEDKEDSRSYRARRDRRRRERPNEAMRDRTYRARRRRVEKLRRAGDEPPPELKPYDVEIVYVVPKVKLPEKGQLTVALPTCDIPTGHLAWAVFLPRTLRVVDAEGTLKEVSSFSLPFRHFADAEYARRFAHASLAKAEELKQSLRQLAQVQEKLATLAVAAKAQGVLPVRVEIPVTGQISRFEKFLVVDEAPEMTLTYRRKTD